MTERERQVFEMIKKYPMISHGEIAKELGITRSTVAVYIASIMQQGYIAGKGYIISEDYVVCIGTAIVDIFGFAGDNYSPTDKNPDSRVRISSGGATRNIGENLARLGYGVKILGAVGDDFFGKKLQEDCTAAGMDVSHMRIVQGESTGTYICLMNSEGEPFAALTDNSISKYQTVDYFKSNHYVLQNAKAIVMAAEPAEGFTAYLKETYPRLPIIGDVGTHTLAQRILKDISSYHTLKANLPEAQALAGIPIEGESDLQKAADIVLSKGVRRFLITLGADGVYYKDANGLTLRKKTKKLEQVVNSTGAGDAFTAGFLYCVLKGEPVDYAVDFAMAASIVTLGHESSINPNICSSLVKETMEQYKI